MRLGKNKLYEIADKIVEEIGKKEFIDNLLMAMSGNELQSNLEEIDRTHGLNLFDNEDED
ncbi:hypothetical protein RyT2_02050 [Pseudolactococcus yaeyamensis]